MTGWTLRWDASRLDDVTSIEPLRRNLTSVRIVAVEGASRSERPDTLATRTDGDREESKSVMPWHSSLREATPDR